MYHRWPTLDDCRQAIEEEQRKLCAYIDTIRFEANDGLVDALPRLGATYLAAKKETWAAHRRSYVSVIQSLPEPLNRRGMLDIKHVFLYTYGTPLTQKGLAYNLARAKHKLLLLIACYWSLTVPCDLIHQVIYSNLICCMNIVIAFWQIRSLVL